MTMPSLRAGSPTLEALIVDDDVEVRELLAELDANSAVLADAVLDRTPAQAAHEQRAVRVQQEGSGR